MRLKMEENPQQFTDKSLRTNVFIDSKLPFQAV
jgi:hypothetical protein